jgi:hypothetical protein
VANPFQGLYASERAKSPVLCQALDKIGDVLMSLQDQLSELTVHTPLTLADSGLPFVTNTLYKQNDVITYSGHVYVRKLAGRGSTAPNLDTRNWTLLV